MVGMGSENVKSGNETKTAENGGRIALSSTERNRKKRKELLVPQFEDIIYVKGINQKQKKKETHNNECQTELRMGIVNIRFLRGELRKAWLHVGSPNHIFSTKKTKNETK
ncbi:unnamed protein product [Arctogadus glacialis]|jgi:hypothetical protein